MSEALKKSDSKNLMAKKKANAQKTSGLRQLKSGEILFHEGEAANSLFIIQKGQLRLYKPKGQGFIELAVLRAGEVLGEMAFFDEDGSGKRRSCSAMALNHTEIIEISFQAFGKTIESLNPWFKTIINTLATRLRKTNSRVKELESNQTALNYGTGGKDYEFLRALDTVKILSTIFLVFKSHGEMQDGGISIHRKTLDLYARDIYGLMEAKTEMVLYVLLELGHLELVNDESDLPKLYILKDIELLRSILIFLNTQRFVDETKKIGISYACERLLDKLYQIINKLAGDEKTGECNISPILKDFKSRNIIVNVEHLDDAKHAGIVTDVIVKSDEELIVEIDVPRFKQLYPIIRFVNHLDRESRKQKSS